MIKYYRRIFHKISNSLSLNMDFKNSDEFIKKYTIISLQRAKLFKWVTFFVCFFSFFLDLILSKDGTIDLLYRQVLIFVHLIGLVLSLVYVILYRVLEKSQKYRFSSITKAVVISDVFLTLLAGAILSINSQRFTGNIDAYIMVVFVVAMVAPMYPKWVLGVYAIIHTFFLTALSFYYQNNTVFIKQANATSIVLVALVVFMMFYKYHIKHFLNEERLKEDKGTFLKLFEINPFPLIICNFQDGKIRYANRRALLFYDIKKEQLADLNHKDIYKNESDVNIIGELLKTNKAVNNYIVEQKTFSGAVKRLIVNYELIDYFGEQSILMGVADIAEIKRIEQELTMHANVDCLTSVFNRRSGMELVKKKYERAKQEKSGFTLCFIDIDNLKTVNDKFGHLEGDSFIIEVCKVIKEEIRSKGFIFRYGGDEFMILFDSDEEAEINSVCRRIAQRFEALNKSNFKPYLINASIGTFSYKPEMDLSLEQIIEIVDRDMYHNKRKKQAKESAIKVFR